MKGFLNIQNIITFKGRDKEKGGREWVFSEMTEVFSKIISENLT